jgi:hypothetical protein
MQYLEKLTLYLRIVNQNALINGNHLHNEILVHMPHLQTFIFYISTRYKINESVYYLSKDHIEQTFTNIKYGQIACIIDNRIYNSVTCHVFSLPFTFTRLEWITNGFLNIVFDTVTHLSVYDTVSLKHEFFMRISQDFPLLKYFFLMNQAMQKPWLGKKLESGA